MKLVFSEAQSDYKNYIFPYAVWAFPEGDENPSTFFANGFLPASRDLDRYYLCRQIRIALREFQASSENRRIFRKGRGIESRLISNDQFDFTQQWRRFCLHYADIKFGKNVMTEERLNTLFNSRVITHLLIFTDTESGKDIGLATLYLEPPGLAYYYYAFYNLNYYERNLGMYMMTSAVDYFAKQKFMHIYLGTCYSRNALYKTQFSGAEFTTGFCWSKNLKELKYFIRRDHTSVTQHLAETVEFRKLFYESDLEKIVQKSEYSLQNLRQAEDHKRKRS